MSDASPMSTSSIAFWPASSTASVQKDPWGGLQASNPPEAEAYTAISKCSYNPRDGPLERENRAQNRAAHKGKIRAAHKGKIGPKIRRYMGP